MANGTQDHGLEQTTEPWRGSLKQQVHVPVDKAWSVVREFCGLNKWIKSIRVCDRIEGEEGKPGCVRYLRGVTFSKDGKEESWATERLVFLDDENRTQSYKLAASSMGLLKYQAWMKFDHLDEKSCTVTWNFEAEPLDGFTEELLANYMTGKYAIILGFLEDYCT